MSKTEELLTLYRTCKSNDSMYRISEIDTQVLFVEPILQMAGWDIRNPSEIRRANRDNKTPHFDIEAFRDVEGQMSLLLAIECKAIDSSEYNIEKLQQGTDIGALCAKCNGWVNMRGDGVGQIRSYCLSYRQFDLNRTIPILTNGFSWTLFKPKFFLDSTQITHPIRNTDILASIDISKPHDFEEILQIISKR